jgi:hypothetical protein
MPALSILTIVAGSTPAALANSAWLQPRREAVVLKRIFFQPIVKGPLNASHREAIVANHHGTPIAYHKGAALPSKMKKHGFPAQTPVAIIGRLARQLGPEWKGLGGDLLHDALTRILAIAQNIGVRAVLVHALDEDATGFWKAFEFIDCPIGSRTFYLPTEEIIRAIA